MKGLNGGRGKNTNRDEGFRFLQMGADPLFKYYSDFKKVVAASKAKPRLEPRSRTRFKCLIARLIKPLRRSSDTIKNRNKANSKKLREKRSK